MRNKTKYFRLCLVYKVRELSERAQRDLRQKDDELRALYKLWTRQTEIGDFNKAVFSAFMKI